MVSNCNKQINANRTVVHFEVTEMHSKPSCLQMIWIVWKGWASLCIFAEIGFSRFGYEWGFFACFHACRAFMLGAAMHTWLQIRRLNGIVTHPTVSNACKCMSSRWEHQNDKRFKLFERVRKVRATASNQIGKLLKIALRCVFMWRDTSSCCTLSTLGFLVWCTAYIDSIGICWLRCTLHARLMAGSC